MGYGGKCRTKKQIKNTDNTQTKHNTEQESSAVADKTVRHKSMPNIAPIRRTYNVVASNTGLSSFV